MKREIILLELVSSAQFFNVVLNRMNTSFRYLFVCVILFHFKLILFDMNLDLLLFILGKISILVP